MPGLRMDPTTVLLFKRGLRRGLLTLLRERGWWSSLASLAGVLLLVQLFIIVCLTVQGVGHLLRTQTDLRLEIRDTATDRQVQEFTVALRQLPEVSAVKFITREQAYERERAANPDLIRFLEQFKIENPFPDTLAVTLATLDGYDRFSQFIRGPQWKDVVDPQFLSQLTDQERDIRQMLQLTDAGRTLVVAFLVLAGGLLLFVVVELTRRRAFLRKEEVFVERMSGAQEAEVVLPFATEATVLLFFAVLLSVGALFALLGLIPSLMPTIAYSTVLAPLRAETWWRLVSYGPLLVVFQLLLAPAVGVAGAYLGTRGQRLSLATI